MKYWVSAVALMALGVGYLVQTELHIRSHQRELQAMTANAAAMSTTDLRRGMFDCVPSPDYPGRRPKNGVELCSILQREINVRTERIQLVVPQKPEMWIP